MITTTNNNLEYITINGIQYKLTPINNLECNQVKSEFEDFLDKLDPDIYNRSLENYGNTFSLKYFSDLYTTNLDENGINKLKEHIHYFKQAVKEECVKMIEKLSEICKEC